MDYYDACEATVSRQEAHREIEKHSADWTAFLAECGDKTEYEGREVLDWLGY